MPRIMRAVALMALLAVPMVHAQATTADLPDLATVTGATSTSDAETTATSDATTGETTAASTGDNSETSATDSAESTSTASDDTTASGTSATTTATFPDATTSSTTGSVFSLTGLPTIAGAGVPTLVIPYTAAAPFMQKSTMPEGTVFIAVGAVLAFMGACVLLWRGLVAWSINRSVKRAALASLRGPEKSGPTWKSGAIYGTGKHAYNKEYENGSSMSLDALTSAGKPIKPFKDDHDRRQSSAPQQGLFFSPTAQASNRASSAGFDKFDNRSSTYLPAGYYAPPAEGGGGRASTVGGSLAPYARHSTIASPSPPHSPGLPGSRATSGYYGSRDGLRQNDALRAPSRDGPSSALARDGYGNERSSFLYQQPSSSSLAVGTGGQQSSEQLSGQRAPSAVLDDLFQNHGRMNQG